MIYFFKNESVLCIVAAFAGASMVYVPPSLAYAGYIDFRVLALLFCLMAVVSALSQIGTFHVLSNHLLKIAKTERSLALVLILLCFFTAMFITNDVALITFVPLTISIFHAAEQKTRIFVIVMQTVAANLGSMMTPVGNPQNLYLYSYYNLGFFAFIKTMFPTWLLSLMLVSGSVLLIKEKSIDIIKQSTIEIINKKYLFAYGVLFLLCLMTVFRLIHYVVCLITVCIAMIWMDKSVFRRVDYGLLATFLCFYIFVGNIGSIDSVKQVISALITGHEMIASVLISQIISNVPAAIMLSSFTSNSAGLLMGTNIGGLGTLVASLASLISFKIYTKSEGAQTGSYMLVFTAINLYFLVILLISFSIFRLI